MKLGLGLGISRAGGGGAAYLAHVLLKAGGTDWTAFGTVVGATVTDGFMVFDGVDDYAQANFVQDYAGCSIWIVAEVTATDNAQDTILQINPGSTALVGLEAGVIGQFTARTRLPAGYGTTFYTPVTPANGVTNVANTVALVGLIFETDNTIKTVNGPHGGFKTTRPASVAMTQLVLGQKNAGFFTGMRVGQVVVLDTTDPAIIESYMQSAKATYSLAELPWVTPLVGGMILITGDSIGAGIDASTSSLEWSYLTALDLAADRLEQAISGGQVSTVGLVSPADDAKIAACFSRVMTAPNLTGTDAVISFAGSNDWGSAAGVVPIGTYGDTAETTFYGALWDGFEDFLLNAPAGIVLYLCTTVNTDTTTTNTLGNTILAYDTAIRNFVATKNHARLKMIDTRLAGLVNPADFSDTVHPNDSGHAKLAAYITADIAARYGVVR